MNIVYAQTRLQIACKIGKAPGDNRRLVSQGVQRSKQVFGALCDLELARHLRKCPFIKPLEQSNPGSETLAEVDLAAHGAFGNGADLLANTCHARQLIDDLSFYQGGIHVEYHQTTIAPVHGVLLESEVGIQCTGHFQQVAPEQAGILQRTTHGELHAGFTEGGQFTQRNTT